MTRKKGDPSSLYYMFLRHFCANISSSVKFGGVCRQATNQRSVAACRLAALTPLALASHKPPTSVRWLRAGDSCEALSRHPPLLRLCAIVCTVVCGLGVGGGSSLTRARGVWIKKIKVPIHHSKITHQEETSSFRRFPVASVVRSSPAV